MAQGLSSSTVPLEKSGKITILLVDDHPLLRQAVRSTLEKEADFEVVAEAGDGKEDLEAHLKGTVEGKENHFFDVSKFPSAAFEITGTESLAAGKTRLSGNLDIKGQKHNISFPVNITNDGDQMIIESEAFTIDRTKWNVNYGSKSIFEDLGDKFINDDIELKISIKAKKA